MNRQKTRNLKRAVANRLAQFYSHEGFQIMVRPLGINFDEKNIIVRFDINECSGLKIGDRVFFRNNDDDCLTSRHVNSCKKDFCQGPQCPSRIDWNFNTVAAFVEVPGIIMDGKIKIVDMFCVLANTDKEEILGAGTYNFGDDTPIIPLFWAQGLEKIPN